MQDAGDPVRHRGAASGLDPDQAGSGVDEAGEGARRVRSAADAGHDDVGIRPVQQRPALRMRLLADHPLELPHHVREGVRSHDRADAVVRGVDAGDPLPQRLVHGSFEGATPRCDGADFGAEQLHAEHVQLLALGVDLTHEDGALEPEQRGRGRRGHAVLPRAGLGDDAVLAHPPGEQRLADHVVQLVRTGVREVLPFEQDADPQPLRQTRALGDRRGAPAVGAQQIVELGPERRVGPGVVEPLLQLEARRHERLRHEPTAELAEATVRAGTAHAAAAAPCFRHASLQS